MNMGIIAIFAAFSPVVLWVAWRMPAPGVQEEMDNFLSNPVYYAGWLTMWIGHLIEWLIPVIAWITLQIVYNETIVEMYEIWLTYVVYYSFAAIEGIVAILFATSWGLYESNTSFIEIECFIVLLVYIAFSIGMTFLFYRFYEETMMFYDPEIRASFEEELERRQA